jgi:hypothetical protein
MKEFGEYLESYGDRLPAELETQYQQVVASLG